MPLTTLVDATVISVTPLNANFALAVLTDTSKTITVTHTWSAIQTFAAGITIGNAGVASGMINSADSMAFNVDSDNSDGTNVNYFVWQRDTTSASGGTELMRLTAAGVLTILGTASATNMIATSAAAAVSAGQIGYGGTTQTTVGAAGGASALPATPTGYAIINVAGTDRIFPFYAKS